MAGNVTSKPEDILKRILLDARQVDYRGYNKHDGLLSPILRSLLGWNRIGRLIAVQLVTRAPWNIRPLLLIPRTINPKGLGLFADANLRTFSVTGDEPYLDEAQRLLSRLIDTGKNRFPGMSWGYQYPWQDVGFYAPATFPNRVVTCWIGFAFFRAWEVTRKEEYLQTCREICTFLRESPNRIVDTSEELCYSYVPDSSVTWAVMDVSALCGKMFALTGTAAGDQALLDDATRSIQYVARRQTSYGGWFYTDPPGDSHITHDNYHTGIILDCLLDYMDQTGNRALSGIYSHGLRFYHQALFTPDGAPKWMNDKTFPHDIHGAAQGIITFSKASKIDPAWKDRVLQILSWTLRNLYDKTTNEFFYQRTRLLTKKFTLLRWCQAWMGVALSEKIAMDARLASVRHHDQDGSR